MKIVDGQEVECSDEEEAAIRAEWAANDAVKAEDLKLNGYKYLRKEAYPYIGDQLDMLWHSMDVGELPKSNDFYNAIAEVKKKFPK